MQFVLQALEMQKPHAQRSWVELSEMMNLLITHCAVMVAGGHHSGAQTLLPGRKPGYLSNLPDPLKEKMATETLCRQLMCLWQT
ncbi:hypothetical protein NTD86_15110 [Pseudomonas sp. 7P_10.2_Bac1]|uniref:hypothetical protein n=1 Tax=Pseudomonas sp. 7P_10.2_Bac1 TaxID=2971614 RepID=UPI0021C801F0|nr:hypothetical protein [Pseudomonas sp. 7P_10.2_Bac1]MCU1728313.1 hypothetical protein [Pseudomonas sp. 7P_10.2_Bac1]